MPGELNRTDEFPTRIPTLEAESLEDDMRLEAADGDDFVTGEAASQEAELRGAAVELFGKKAQEGGIGSRIDGRSRDADAQFRGLVADDFVTRGAGLDFERKSDFAGMEGEPRREVAIGIG
jgi:hypothetical protein